MKKGFVILVLSCILIGIGVSPISTFAKSNEIIDLTGTSLDKAVPMIDERVVNVLTENNIDFHIENGYIIKLNESSPKLLVEVNNLLEESMNIEMEQKVSVLEGSGSNVLGQATTFAAKATYPTAWTAMKLDNRITSKKFTKATKTAFVAALAAWMGPVTGGASVMAQAAGVGFGGYYFVNTDEQNVYHFMTYSYREKGPGKFGPTGSFMGDYEIRKVDKTTKSSAGTGGQTNTRYKASTAIIAFY